MPRGYKENFPTRVTAVKTRFSTRVIVSSAILLIGGGFFIAAVQKVLPKSCEDLPREKCVINETCQAIYNGKGEMQKCSSLAVTEKGKRSVEKEMCEQSHGQWKNTDYGPYCDCTKTEKVFQKNYGCV